MKNENRIYEQDEPEKYDDLIDTRNLEEGEIYAYRKGILTLIPRSDEDLPKLKVTDDVFKQVGQLQRAIRKNKRGYKPDRVLVTSALLLHAATLPNIENVVWKFAETITGNE